MLKIESEYNEISFDRFASDNVKYYYGNIIVKELKINTLLLCDNNNKRNS